MQERTRYRVTGSLFLFALAVIFLPMLFDGAGTEPVAKVPPAPQDQFTPNARPRFEDIVPTTDVVERVTELQAEVDEEGFVEDTGTRVGEPVLSAADTNTSVWAVQAATFGSVDNARNFRKKLREAGFEAFISSARAEQAEEVLYRVAVGPLLSPLDAQDLRSRIAQEFSVSPQIVAMEP